MDIKALFNQAAQSYDQTRRRYIPGFDQFYGTVLELIPYPMLNVGTRTIALRSTAA